MVDAGHHDNDIDKVVELKAVEQMMMAMMAVAAG
jgi:hypothetical protein